MIAKSASLIISRVSQNKKLEILFMKRPENFSFGGLYAFPGGKLDKDDAINCKNSLNYCDDEACEGLKYSAVRETFEELGLIPGKLTNYPLKTELTGKEDFLKIEAENEIYWNRFHPFLRLITIPSIKRRFDTYFYIHNIKNKSDVLNFNLYRKTGILEDLYNLDNIIANPDEVTSYIWMEPDVAISEFIKGNFPIAPPQIIILTMLKSFSNLDEVENYFSKANNAFFPNMLLESKENRKLIFPFDTDYITELENSDNNKENVEMIKKEISKLPLNESDKFFLSGKFSLQTLLEPNLTIKSDIPTPLRRLSLLSNHLK